LVTLGLGLVACKEEAPVDPAPTGPECGYHDECEGGVCFDGQCAGTRTCLERSDCGQLAMCEGFNCICNDQRCLPICTTDENCPGDGHCLDGVCERYPVNFDGMKPGGAARSTLSVGISRVELDFPMGVSMAGYGMRGGPQTPYRFSLGGSSAWFDKPDVRALAFDDGAELLILLRIPLSWSTDFLIADTAKKVQDRVGLNVIDSIITTSPHSHSHPARFWHLVVDKYFGLFGYDEFQFEIFDRLTTSFADAIVMALDARQPAKFGYTVLDDFDPNNRIHRDRRERNDGLPNYMDKDRRMVVARIDDASGEPIAVLAHLGLHGTVFGGNNPILSGDAGGGIEVALTNHASEKYGRDVMGVFVQGNAGDVSPAGDDRGHPPLERIQLLGERSWDVIGGALDQITTSADARIGVVSGRVPISHEHLGYGEGEFHDTGVECEGTPSYFRFGAFQCVEGYFDDRDPATKFTDGDLACVFGIECLTAGYPVPQFQKTRLSVAQVGGLGLVTMPGEPLSQFGRDVSARVTDAVSDVSTSIVVGYSQDHHFYLLSEDDWWQGGYEASRDIWGWRLAPYLADHAVRLAGQLDAEPASRDLDDGNIKPMYWDVEPERRTPVEPNETETAPDQIRADVPATVERMHVVELVWAGGHPGVDRPRVVLEDASGPVRRVGGATYDDAAFEMLVRYDGKCNRRNCAEHQWRVAWEDHRAFALGRYRFSVEGQAWVGGQTTPYSLKSDWFELVPSTKLRAYQLELSVDTLSGRVVEPAALAVDADGNTTPNGHLLRSRLVPARYEPPVPDGTMLTVTGTVSYPDGSSHALTGTAQVDHVTESRGRITRFRPDGTVQLADARDYATSRFSIALPANAGAGAHVVQLVLTDPAGNSVTTTATITR